MTPGKPQDKKIRGFIGVAPQAELRNSLTSYQQRLKQLLSDQRLRWTQPDNLHLTLKFMGHIDQGQLRALKQQLILQLEGAGAFVVTLTSIQWFPSVRVPRVVALLSTANTELQALAARCDQAAQQIGVSSSNPPFRGHITLARNRGKNPENRPLEKIIEPLTLQVDRVSIFQSQLTPQGPIYTEQDGIDLPQLSSLGQVEPPYR